MGATLQIKGLDAAIKRANKLANTIKKDVQDNLNEFADNVSTTAKRLAPADEGHLRGAINPVRGKGDLTASIVCAVNYAAFLEFGTRKFAAQYVATLPADWQSYAASFKGKTPGTFDEFILRLVGWVRRKGIGAHFDIKTRRRVRVGKQSAATTAEADAYAIALYILRNGIRPHPFLYPAVMQHLPELRKNMDKLLEA